MNKTLTVIDACPGTGKTTHAIQVFNSAPAEDKWLYITPYLDEVERIERDCPGFIQPMTSRDAQERSKATGKEVVVHDSIKYCKTKSEAIQRLVEEGHNITSTHSLFRDVDEDTAELFRVQGYKLVMDEVLTPIDGLDARTEEVKAMLDADVIRPAESLIEGKKVFKAVPGDQDGFTTKYNGFRDIAANGRLIIVDNAVLVWLLPPNLMEVFDEVYAMTYMFDCQPLSSYFEMFNIPIVKKTLWNNRLVDYSEEIANSKLIGITDKIEVHEKGRINDIGNATTALSKTWFKSGTKAKTQQLGNNLYNFFHRLTNSPVEERMWTTYKAFRANVETHKEARRFANGFLSCNVRATNEYAHKSTVAYCCNLHMDPFIKKFFQYGGADPHEKEWALSEMLQWIWRSRIRNDGTITAYVPAKRMRGLLKAWLKDVERWTKGADLLSI